MPGPFIHDIDPIICRVGNLYLWWYGASYTFGFVGAWLWLRRNGQALGMNQNEVVRLMIFLMSGVLLGGRLVEVLFYEWSYYGSHPAHIPAVWIGGMSTHGILLGAVIGTWLFCRSRSFSFLKIADELAIAGAWIMGMGRIGNFIDGQISGSLTDHWWGVKFPDLEGFRHPVVLYDGLKNLFIIPILLLVRRFRPPPGVLLGHFLLWYGFLRVFVDLFREYRTDLLGLPPGQGFNALMAVAGLGLILWASAVGRRSGKRKRTEASSPVRAIRPEQERWRRILRAGTLAVLLFFPLVIPSDWTQDVPERYGARHEGLAHSFYYPVISEQDDS